MAALCAWAASPGEKSANSATTALCARVICPGKGVKGRQIWLGEFWLDAILAPTRLKVHGTKLLDALHPVHGKFGLDALWLHSSVEIHTKMVDAFWLHPVENHGTKMDGRKLAPPQISLC